jgi:hypothetical protein
MAAHVGSSFNERLNYLIEHVHRTGRGPYTDTEIARGITEHGLGTLTKSAIGKHRQPGANPTLTTIKIYADFFGVSASYFTDTADAAQRAVLHVRESAVLQQLQKDTDMAEHLERYGGLSTSSRRVVADLSERLRAIEKAHRTAEQDDAASE